MVKSLSVAAGLLLVIYLIAAYGLVPFAWKDYTVRHPGFDDDPRLTRTEDGHPGDPLNVSLIGSAEDVSKAMAEAGWYLAQPLGVSDDLRIAADSVLERPYDNAPVSNLYLYDRKQDIAFEQPHGDDPRQRNHVRLWWTGRTVAGDKRVWIGAASYDERIGFSHTTGQITHHIAPDVDKARDRLMLDLKQIGAINGIQTVADFHTVREGRNGGGDRWETDGALWFATISDSGDATLRPDPD